jgi:GntR family transcriptional regulator
MKLQCDSTARTPIYRQLIEQVREAVARGRVEAGDRLPSVRQLSKQLVVNPNTIARAYTELEREGLVHTRPGLGVFIASHQPELSNQARERRLAALIDRFLTEAVHLGFAAEQVTAMLAKRMEQFQFVEK